MNLPIINKESERTVIRIEQYHKKIVANANRLYDLIEKLLDVATLESNNFITLHKEKIDIVQEIKEIIKTLFEQRIKEKK